ncbi:acyl-CoA dehydrogenase family protein [Streptomyces fuscichromogenes]|uniref:Acyl-CoA dehydrogenase n=1 Tax=Streptomyces fuscichromogenes TaxID=1324013 RepID=A0A917XGF6_9ACTN|nr:acyl-CoA dehydrogenase family protein [Streptomyces fuscichromogenes]GGN22438.1 acyl-CoA dehydrogenase [Streptomyces fuscichromogenes]
MNDDLDLLYTDVEESLRDAVRTLMARRWGPERGIARYDGDTSDPGLWSALSGELGLAGLLVPEEFGGAGASAREAAVVLEELGRAMAPVPYLTSAVVAARVLVKVADKELAGEVAGGQVAALAVPLSAAPDGSAALAPVTVGGDGCLSGEVRGVAGALDAEVLIVPVTAATGTQLWAVERAAVRITPVVSLDMTRQLADVDLAGATGRLLADGDMAVRAVDEALELGAALLASEQVGLAQWCLDTTLDYVKTRRQFGRVVGGFQALKHRLADLYVQVETAHAVARYAAVTAAADDPDRAVAASVAQAYCADVAVLAAEECVQMHGGIAMTWEHPAHLYLKRAKADQLVFGTPGNHLVRLSPLIDLPARGTAGQQTAD